MNDTHLYKPLKDYARKLASLWYVAHLRMLSEKKSSISDEEYQNRVSKLMSVSILRNKTPEWLWSSVQHISKHIPGEERNLIIFVFLHTVSRDTAVRCQ